MNNTLTILHSNIQSIISNQKRIELDNIIRNHKPDIISLNETFLKPTHSLEIEGFKIFRHDRLLRKGGGSALCVSSKLTGNIIEIDKNILIDEYVVGFLFKTISSEIAIFSIYSPPSNMTINHKLFEFINSFKKIIITGDLNAKSKLWYCHSDNQRGLELETLLSHYNLHLLNNKSPTYKRGKSVLDLSICSNSLFSKSSSFRVLRDRISDHQPTLTKFIVSPSRTPCVIKRVNYELLNQLLEANCPNTTITDLTSIDQAVLDLNSVFSYAITSATKEIQIIKPHKNSVEIPKDILETIRMKRSARRKLAKRSSPENKIRFNMLNNKVKSLLNKFMQSRLQTKFSELNNFNQSSSKHWRIINNLKQNGDKKTIPSVLHSQGVQFNDDQAIAEKFGSILSSTFGPTSHIHLPQLQPLLHASSTEPKINLNDLEQALKTCNMNSAPGDDGITNKIISKSPGNIKNFILKIFQISLEIGHIPVSWKAAEITMIHKKDKPKNEFSSYRPISLLNCLCKLLEKIINRKLVSWAEDLNLLPPEQSGFRTKRSCQDHILRITQHVTNGFNNKKLTGAVFFDLEKAFDTTPHAGIIHKLEKNNIHLHLLAWIISFLTQRSFKVKWKNKSSNSFPINRGVPQGSCLSPTLFNLYFSDVVLDIPNNTLKGLFADDLCIWTTHTSIKVIEHALQQSVHKITNYCDRWGLTISKKKTTCMIFTTAGLRANYYRTYNINIRLYDTFIPLDPHPIFLGIQLDPKLNFKPHLESIEKKLASKVNLFKKIKSLPINHKRINIILFKSLIRSIFDYSFVILSSSSQKIIGDLQKIQNRILRAIKYFPPRTKISEIHSYFKIPTIKDRSDHLLRKFTLAKTNHDLITTELEKHSMQPSTNSHKPPTTFDQMLKFLE